MGNGRPALHPNVLVWGLTGDDVWGVRHTHTVSMLAALQAATIVTVSLEYLYEMMSGGDLDIVKELLAYYRSRQVK